MREVNLAGTNTSYKPTVSTLVFNYNSSQQNPGHQKLCLKVVMIIKKRVHPLSYKTLITCVEYRYVQLKLADVQLLCQHTSTIHSLAEKELNECRFELADSCAWISGG